MGEAVVDPNTYCHDCGATVPAEIEGKAREPCPACGSLVRERRVLIEETLQLREELHLKGRHGRPGEVAPHVELKTGDSYSRRLGKWMKRTLQVDREKNLYEETVTDPDTGEVIHHDAGPLTEHTGHGSARRGQQRSRDETT